MNCNRHIENPLFFKWIFHPTPELDVYWNHYLSSHPEERSQLTELKAQIETYIKPEDRQLTDTQKRSLALKIARKLDDSDRATSRSMKFRKVLQYAAIGILFFLTGGGLVYLYMEGRQGHVVVEYGTMPDHEQEPVLILGDRSQVKLNRGESQLEYSDDGKIILNNEQTLREESENTPPEMNTLVIPYGSRSAITLADGTKVWLNAGSRLIYPSKFVDKTREVFLIGEAYFDVQKNDRQPFVVRTSDMQLEVLGTKFNMTAYPEDFAVQTVLAEGSVVIKKAGGGRKEKGVLLEPGYMAYFNRKNQEVRTQKVNVDDYTLWTEGLFSFTNTDFNRIIKKLERYYNIQFQFDDPFKGGIQVSGKLDVTKEREEVFKYLERLTGLQIIEMNNKLYVIK